MHTPTVLVLSSSLLLMGGCALSAEHAIQGEPPQVEPPVEQVPEVTPTERPFVTESAATAVPATVVVPPSAPSVLGQCLLDGGELLVVDTIDNNDTADHGTVLAFDVSEGRRLAVSTIDGTIKFWSLDEFLGSVGLAEITYGPEIRSMSRTIDFWGEEIVSGDDRGAVIRWGELGRQSVGGAEPGTPIVAVAVNAEAGLLAQAAANGELVVRSLPEFEGETVMVSGITVNDLEFVGDRLLVATHEALELRRADTLALIASYPARGGAQVVRVNDGWVAFGADGKLFLTDANLDEPVAVGPLLGFVDAAVFDGLAAELFAIGDGSTFGLQVTDEDHLPLTMLTTLTTGEELPPFGITPARMVLDPLGELLFVTMHTGKIHLVGCR